MVHVFIPLFSGHFKQKFNQHSRDRVRTVVNVLGDALGAGIVGHMSQSDLNTPENPQLNVANTTFEIETHKEI